MVSGSRTISDKDFVYYSLSYTREYVYYYDAIIEGEAGENDDSEKRKISVDLLAKQYAYEHNIECISKELEWDIYGNKAGFVRNNYMIKICDKGIAIWDGESSGTEQAIKGLIKENKLLLIFLYNYDQEIVKKVLYKYRNYITKQSFPFYKRRSFER